MPEVWLTTPVRQMRMRLIPVQRANRPEQPEGICAKPPRHLRGRSECAFQARPGATPRISVPNAAKP